MMFVFSVSVMTPIFVDAQQRSIGGVMRGREIEIIQRRGVKLKYVLREARLRNGKLELTGHIGSRSFTGAVVGTTARATNPIPRATDASAPRRSAAQQNAERNEQTQSLYASTEAGSGCELVYLKMSPGFPAAQLGVVLAHQDNPLGERINQEICRIRRALDARSDAGPAVEALNQLLKQ
ncbi:MAG: hypothetical protein KF868_09005 [Acidobacteria bacterium]|nr:hypothetical protein [Acidobacteriota bacterium]